MASATLMGLRDARLPPPIGFGALMADAAILVLLETATVQRRLAWDHLSRRHDAQTL